MWFGSDSKTMRAWHDGVVNVVRYLLYVWSVVLSWRGYTRGTDLEIRA